ncbi:MAG: amino acid permease, partial [Thermoplasmatota archaeon]
AVFFPAATGIMAGANMSGELKNPKKSIPIGTLSAIIVSVIIYLVLSFWLKGAASSSELIDNYLVLIDESFYAPVVLGGLLAATFSSALNSLVGASRILQAMGEHNILPGSGWFSKKSEDGVPRNAIIITGIIVVLGLLVRSLNTIAPLITMFFLITYAMLNVVILLEQQLELVSFRPLLKVPRFIPLLGAGGSFFAMFIINPVFGIVAVSVVIIFYYVLMHRHLGEGTPYGDVRSSLFVALAEWAAKKSSNLPISKERAWVPNILIPAEDPTEVRGVSNLLRDITYPRGSISMLGVNIERRNVRIEKQFQSLSKSYKDDGIYSDYTMIEGEGFAAGTISSMQTLRRSLFSPNITFLRMPSTRTKEEEVEEIIKKSTENRLGVVLFANHPSAGLGQEKVINLWIPEQCQDWQPPEKLPNCDLSILMAYKLKINWNAEFNMIAPTGDKDKVEEVEERIDDVIETGRLPVDNVEVVPEDVDEYIEKAPQADLNIFSLSPKPDFTVIRERLRKTNSACMYCRDSTEESVLA